MHGKGEYSNARLFISSVKVSVASTTLHALAKSEG